jgi:TrpR family trp operon transcriptional repressor
MKLNISDLFNREKNNKEFSELMEVILKIRDRDELETFLKGILTPKELIEIPNRLAIVKMLKKGVSQHEIAGKLKVGVATVTRGSKEIREGRFNNV